jgi:hypothetical protein
MRGSPGRAGDDLTVTPGPPRVEIAMGRHLARLLTVLAVLASGPASGMTSGPWSGTGTAADEWNPPAHLVRPQAGSATRITDSTRGCRGTSGAV